MSGLGFARTLGFGALAALALVFNHAVLAGWMGSGNATVITLAAALVAYAALLARSPRHALRNAAAATAGAAISVVAAPTLAVFAIGLALTLGLIRATLERRMPPLRAAAVELTLGVGGLLLAAIVGGHSALLAAFGLWAYALVQSLYFLVPGRRSPRAASGGDPFDAAHGRLVSLLDDV